MQLPIQITFRDIPPSESVEQAIREKAEKLQRYYDRIISCKVVIESPHQHRQKGKLYHVRIDLVVPQGELVVSRDNHKNHAHEDVYVAVRDAFEAARRQLEHHAARQRGEVKHHEGAAPPAHVVQVYPHEDHGFLMTTDGRQIYFHRNSVPNGQFDQLTLGTEVHYSEVQGTMGPQASHVVPLRRRA